MIPLLYFFRGARVGHLPGFLQNTISIPTDSGKEKVCIESCCNGSQSSFNDAEILNFLSCPDHALYFVGRRTKYKHVLRRTQAPNQLQLLFSKQMSSRCQPPPPNSADEPSRTPPHNLLSSILLACFLRTPMLLVIRQWQTSRTTAYTPRHPEMSAERNVDLRSCDGLRGKIRSKIRGKNYLGQFVPL